LRRPPVTVAADEVGRRLARNLGLGGGGDARDVAGPEQTDGDVARMFTRAIAWRECPVSRERTIEIKFS
jgi:hypothetical protein